MKRHALLIVTTLTLGLTGVMLLQAQGSSPSHRAHSPRHHESPGFSKSHGPSLDEAAHRWLRGEPKHWRDCLLQH
jgi:hypothetical protein